MDKLLKYNGVQEALKFLREDDERTLQEHLEMCQIPAPSYEEGEKAEYVRKKMVDVGLSDVHVDEVGNVLGTWGELGYIRDMDREDVKYFRRVCETKMMIDNINVVRHQIEINFTMEPNEITFVRIRKIG